MNRGRNTQQQMKAARFLMAALIAVTGVLATSATRADEPPATAPAVAVPNGGFEEGGEQLAHWVFFNGDGGAGSWEWDTQHKHGGARSLRVTNTGEKGFSAIYSDMIPVQAGCTYEVSAQVHVEGKSTAKIYLMISQHPADSLTESPPNTYSAIETMDTGEGWKPLSAKVAVRPGNARLRVYALVAWAPAVVSFDDFQVVALPAAP